MLFLLYNDLRDMGIPYSRTHLYRLIKMGKFPEPVKLGDTPKSRIAWRKDDILAWANSRAGGEGEASK